MDQTAYALKQVYCSECGAEIYNWYSRSPFYNCAHSPWGTPGQRPTDRDVLDAVLKELQAIRRMLTPEAADHAR